MNDFINEIKNIYFEKYNFDNNLNMLHELLNTDLISDTDKEFYKTMPIFGKTDRKSIFVKNFYEYYDKNNKLNNLYLNFIKEKIKPLFNEKKLVIQKTPNLRVHIPGQTNIGYKNTDTNKEIIGVHYDGEFGHPKEEINFILAITDMFDTNSIYYEPTPNSKLKYEKYYNIKLKKNNIWQGYLNKCKHYNKINKTNKTRISIDFRIIPYSSFISNKNNISATKKQKFIIGDYYILF